MREPLYRSRSNRMLFGVGGGMADWLDLDPSVVRLVWVLLMLAGIGIVLYIVAAIVIPEGPAGYGATRDQAAAGATPAASSAAPASAGPRPARAAGGSSGAVIFGALLVVIGGWLLVDRYIDIDTSWFVPGALIVVGIALVIGALGRR